MKIDKHAYGEDYGKERSDKIVKILSVAVCLVIIFVIGILAWALPQPTYSEYEKRDLNQMPEFSIESLFKGEYTLGVELAYADTFAFRENFVKMQAMIEEARGIRIEGAAIYGPVPGNTNDEDDKIPPSSEVSSEQSSESSSSDNISRPDNTSSSEMSSSESSSSEQSSESSSSEAQDDGEQGETVAGIFLYKGAAYELFGGSKKAAEYYAGVVNKYGDAFGSGVKVYNMVIPKHAEFGLTGRYDSLSNSEKDSIDYIYSMLDSDVIKVDAYSVLKEHSDEYIYFNTDHHWTGLGAYYAYTAFMDAAGLSYYDYESYTKHIIEPFLGTLYAGTDRAKALEDNPDYVEWCEFPVTNKTYQYNKSDLGNYFASSVMHGYAKGANSYGVFLGGDFPLTVIKTNVNNGRKLVIIKESYGNAPATFIAAGFEETYVVDERYYDGNLVDLVNSRGITDVLIINNCAAANTNFHIANIESLLTQTYSGAIAYPEG
ncbi:MAG: hypothetical protein IJ306_03350 [Oscillospiraceae bacterium]|nr:hypothetical protein [Oscillospiraceae bacterium]